MHLDESKKWVNKRYKKYCERARRYNQEPPDYSVLLRLLMEATNCGYCGKQLKFHSERPWLSGPSIDHRRPYASGGHNAPDNLIVVCYGCNLCKSTASESIYRKIVTSLTEDEREQWAHEMYRGMIADKIHRNKVEEGTEE